MKSNSFLAIVIVTVSLFLTGCGSPVMENFPTHRSNIQRTPHYGVNDRVINKNGYVFILDSLQPQKKHPRQVFWAAHYFNNGVHVDWLPEITIKRF